MNRTGNYCAFYVDEGGIEGNLGIFSSSDIKYFGLLKAWKAKDSSFPFIDSHGKTYAVRDGSDWETTLKPRLHERLRASKNVILILSSTTKNSRALREELDYGCNKLGLPLIIIYPELNQSDMSKDKSALWAKLPILKGVLSNVPSVHLPLSKETLRNALEDEDFMIQTKTQAVKCYYYRQQ